MSVQLKLASVTCGKPHRRIVAALVLASFLAMAVMPLARGADPVLVGRWPVNAPGAVFAVVVTNNLAYIAAGWGGLMLIDVSNPARPLLVGSIDTSGLAADVAVAGNLAFVVHGSDRGGALEIIDVSNPALPVRVGDYDTHLRANDVAVAGNLAFVATDQTLTGSNYYASSVHIIDVGNPGSPTRVGSYATKGRGEDVTVAGNLIFMAYGNEGLEIIDVSNPVVPVSKGWYDGAAFGVTVSGNLAFVAEGPPGLGIFDVSNPANPRRVGEFGYVHNPGYAEAVAVSGSLAYLAYGNEGLEIIDVSNPANPLRVGGYDTGGWAYGVAVTGNLAFVAAGEGGLAILSLVPPPVLGISSVGSLPALQISGEVGRQYVLEYVSALSASNHWTALPAFTLTNSPQTLVDDSATNASQRFYRARLAP